MAELASTSQVWLSAWHLKCCKCDHKRNIYITDTRCCVLARSSEIDGVGSVAFKDPV